VAVAAVMVDIMVVDREGMGGSEVDQVGMAVGMAVGMVGIMVGIMVDMVVGMAVDIVEGMVVDIMAVVVVVHQVIGEMMYIIESKITSKRRGDIARQCMYRQFAQSICVCTSEHASRCCYLHPCISEGK
jgi:hypothetical protein